MALSDRRRGTAIAALVLGVAPAVALAQDDFPNGVTISDSDGAVADLFVQDDSVLDGKVCIGNGCAQDETYDTGTLLKLRAANPGIEFHDESGAPYPARDWKLRINDPFASGLDRFALEDLDAGTIPLSIEGGAPDNALYVSNNGQLGLGTSMPGRKLHIQSGNFPAVRLEQDTSTGLTPYVWDIQGTNSYFALLDVTGGLVRPFKVYPGQPLNTLVVKNDGVGIGTTAIKAGLHLRRESDDKAALLIEDGSGFSYGGAPEAFVHVRGEDGVVKLLLEERSSQASPRTLLELQNNGRPEIVMGNTAKGGEWSFGVGTSFFLNTGALGSASSAKTTVFTVKSNGDAILAGTLTTGGTTCGGGCDAVFSDDYDLPSIAEHAAAMRVLGHLPNVGPTVEGAPINVSDKLGRVLNELEHAHLFIAALDDENRALRAELVEMRAEMAGRLARLEAAAGTE